MSDTKQVCALLKPVGAPVSKVVAPEPKAPQVPKLLTKY